MEIKIIFKKFSYFQYSYLYFSFLVPNVGSKKKVRQCAGTWVLVGTVELGDGLR
jgi:hypothetical protein